MNEKNASSRSGLYGESNYPPMFDSEPPPLDDEDGDPGDDDFADFTSFQKTGSNENSWGSWSNWSGNIDMPSNVEEFGKFDGFFEHKSYEGDSQSSKSRLSPENGGTSLNLDISGGISGFETASNSGEFIVNNIAKKMDQSSSLVMDSVSKGIGQSPAELEGKNEKPISFASSKYHEDLSKSSVVTKTNSHYDEDAETSMTFTISNNKLVKDITENVDNNAVNAEEEDDFDDFADFKSDRNKDDIFSRSSGELSCFGNKVEYDKDCNLKAFDGSDRNLENGFLIRQGEIDPPKQNASFGTADSEEKPENFIADFESKTDNVESDIANTDSSGSRATHEYEKKELNYNEVPDSSDSEELRTSKDIRKTDRLSLNFIESDANAIENDKNIHSPIQEEITTHKDNQNDIELSIEGSLSNEFEGSFHNVIQSTLERNSFDDPPTNYERNISSEDAIQTDSKSAEPGFFSNAQLGAFDQDSPGSSKAIIKDSLENIRNDSIVVNSFEHGANSDKDSNVERESFSAVRYLKSEQSFAKDIVTSKQDEFNNDDDFDDFQGMSTSSVENIAGNENKDVFSGDHNIQAKEFDLHAVHGDYDSHHVNFSEKAPKNQDKSPDLDAAIDKKPSIDQNYIENNFDQGGEFGDFESLAKSDALPDKNDSPSELKPTGTKGSFNESYNENKVCFDNDEVPVDDFQNFAVSFQSVDKSDDQMDIQNSASAFVGTSTNSVSATGNTPSEKNDEFDDFQDFSTTIATGKEEVVFSQSVSPKFDDKKDVVDDQWANFSSAEKEVDSKKTTSNTFGDFASFPAEQKQENDDDDDWASFSSPQSEDSFQNSYSETRKESASGNGGVKNLNSVTSTKVFEAKKSDSTHKMMPREPTMPLLLASCFRKSFTTMQPVGLCQASKIEQFLQDERDQELHGIWGRLSGNDDLEETWKLSYTSSTNFKWLLQSVNVAFEKIVKKYRQSSRDTMSSLSPASSVTSFDMENSGDRILVPEPATRLSSLLKPTLLAQSQQKELDLQSVPSVPSVRKGDSGSDPTSETNSLDLEFFSGASLATPVSSNFTGSSSSLNNIELRDIELTTDSSTIKTEPQGDSQPYLPPRSGKGSTSLPFNLASLGNGARRDDISKEARQFLEDVEGLRFMSSTVLMFPSQFYSND